MKRYLATLAGIATLICAGHAFASVLYDSGTPTNPPNSVQLSNVQWLTGQIYFGSEVTITSLEGYLWTPSYQLYGFPPPVDGETFSIAVYSTLGSTPVFQKQAVAPDVGVADWVGLSGLNLVLAPGSYWFAFEVLPTDTFAGGLPVLYPGPDTNPLARNRLGDNGYGTWYTGGGDAFGLRIEGDGGAPIRTGAQIPEPATWAMMLLGMFSLGAALRGQRAARLHRLQFA